MDARRLMLPTKFSTTLLTASVKKNIDAPAAAAVVMGSFSKKWHGYQKAAAPYPIMKCKRDTIIMDKRHNN